jgi:2-iminoacetate synthase ThiH
MSKTENPQGFKSQHIEVTERGVAAAKAALAEAHKKALEAEEAHRLNMTQALEAEEALEGNAT